MNGRWQAYLDELDELRIAAAGDSLCELLGDISGLSFLDIGSGSGLFSLAARNLGARVVSFDHDPGSVWCGRELQRRYWPDDDRWQILQGSIRDGGFVSSLGQFDVVYAWNVLNQSGALWESLEFACGSVAAHGRLALALPPDRGPSSRYWQIAKRAYKWFPTRLR